MADPVDFIEIADFSPGIHSDIHASVYASGVATDMGDGIRGHLPGNGAATVENTWMCVADKTGALVPMNTLHTNRVPTDTGIPTNSYSAAVRPPERAAAYILDVEVSPLRFYDGGNFSWDADNFSIYVLWGFYYDAAGDGTVNGYRAYVLGREYRLTALWQNKLDFMFCRGLSVVSGIGYMPLPAGSLCTAHLDLNARPSVILSQGVRFDVRRTLPVPVAMATVRHTAAPGGDMWTDPTTDPLSGFATELSWLTDVPVPPGGGGTHKRPSNWAPALNRFAPALSRSSSIGMGYGGQIFDPFAPPAPPIDDWKFHQEDAASYTGQLRNAPFAPTLLIAHQGRIVFADELGQGDAETSIEYNPAAAESVELSLTRDVIWYSEWGLPIGERINLGGSDDAMTSYIPQLIAEDTPARIGVLGVTTSDELFIVKARGGGAVVRGDLDNPTVRRLPHIEPTFGIASKGVATPIGFVYGSLTGVYAFDGGDTSQKLSSQLDGFFWNVFDPAETGTDPATGSYGRFAYWNGYVFAPNNYIFDTGNGAWWRIGTDDYWAEVYGGFDTDNYQFFHYGCYLVDPKGQLLAFPYKQRADALFPMTVCQRMAQHSLSPIYSWQSHPLVETRGRRQSFQDVRLVVTSDVESTITVTLTGYDETGAAATPVDVVFTTTASRNPQIMREDIVPMFTAEYVQVRIHVNAGDGRAPKIHALRLGLRPRQTTPRHGS